MLLNAIRFEGGGRRFMATQLVGRWVGRKVDGKVANLIFVLNG